MSATARTSSTLREVRAELLASYLESRGGVTLDELARDGLSQWPRVALSVAIGDLVLAGDLVVDEDGRLHPTGAEPRSAR